MLGNRFLFSSQYLKLKGSLCVMYGSLKYHRLNYDLGLTWGFGHPRQTMTLVHVCTHNMHTCMPHTQIPFNRVKSGEGQPDYIRTTQDTRVPGVPKKQEGIYMEAGVAPYKSSRRRQDRIDSMNILAFDSALFPRPAAHSPHESWSRYLANATQSIKGRGSWEAKAGKNSRLGAGQEHRQWICPDDSQSPPDAPPTLLCLGRVGEPLWSKHNPHKQKDSS